MNALPSSLRDLVASGALAHLSTISPDGSPQVTVIWIGLDGEDLVSGHMGWYAKLANIDRDPRVVFVVCRSPHAECRLEPIRRASRARRHRAERPSMELA